MAGKDAQKTMQAQIDARLRHGYQLNFNEVLPERFQTLIDMLRSGSLPAPALSPSDDGDA
ncbi:MAG: hypothetical protein OIF48_08985 [Silicimonas sp.]|nr:hypothetical protein [Silicimonas sp.]